MLEEQCFSDDGRRPHDVYSSRMRQPRSILHNPSTANNQSAELLFCSSLIDSDDPLTEDTQVFTSTSSAAPLRPAQRSNSGSRIAETASRTQWKRRQQKQRCQKDPLKNLWTSYV